jgi:uroporphyrin-III C-methyltransferase/precorrin-2 dehydrogenase/sirohydrochlorin ferrochelatase
MQSDLYPVFLKLTDRPVLLVGGGTVATSKLDALRQAGARVTVVAPSVSDAIAASGVPIMRRKFRAPDLNGQWFVVSAAPPAVNRQVARAAARRRVFVNAVDDPAQATAYLGGVCRRAGVTIAISTDGRAPALAGLLREGLNAMLPDDLEDWMDASREARAHWKAHGVPMPERRPQLLEALNKLYESRARRDDPRQRPTSDSAPGDERQSGTTSASARDDGGLVSLVGAGPGDPDLLTQLAARRLAEADVVLHDGLVTDAVLSLALTAECVCVSRRPGAKVIDQAVVTQRMIDESRAGRRVVRLKAGDPFVLGRGGEEALALAQARVPFEIVPGVTAAVAAPAAAGIPVTHRGIASAFVVVSGHSAEAYVPVLEGLPRQGVTVVVLMGFGERARIARVMMEHGWPGATPAALVSNASQPGERLWIGTLERIGEALSGAPAQDAHTIVVGEVVSLAPEISRGVCTSDACRREHGSRVEDVGARAPVVCA